MPTLEESALNGDLFRPRSHSPNRSISTNSDNAPDTDDELASDISTPSSPLTSGGRPTTGAGFNADEASSGRTGVKGVLADKKSSSSINQAQRTAAAGEYAVEVERRKIVAMTIHEEEAARAADKARSEGGDEEEGDNEVRKWRKARKEELRRNREGTGDADGGSAGHAALVEGVVKRGGLREVGKEGFVSAVERPGWVVILIYEPDIPRCAGLLASTLSLSLSHPPNVTLLRARATTLQFSLLPNPSAEDGGEDDDYVEDEAKADPDVLPTMLAYKDGELVHTWIRVDWEVDESGVEGLLRKSGVLPIMEQVYRQRDLSRESDDDE